MKHVYLGSVQLWSIFHASKLKLNSSSRFSYFLTELWTLKNLPVLFVGYFGFLTPVIGYISWIDLSKHKGEFYFIFFGVGVCTLLYNESLPVLPFQVCFLLWRVLNGLNYICGTESQPAEGGTLVESDRHVSVLCSADGSQNIHSDSIVSITASGETVTEEKDKLTHSPSYLDNKSSFSSMVFISRFLFL